MHYELFKTCGRKLTQVVLLRESFPKVKIALESGKTVSLMIVICDRSVLYLEPLLTTLCRDYLDRIFFQNINYSPASSQTCLKGNAQFSYSPSL